MALLTNEYFDAELLSEFILAKLNQGKWYPQSIYKTINALYYAVESKEEVQTLLQQDKRFDDYPYLRSLLLYLSSIDETTPRENIQARLTALQAQYQSDAWDTARADEFFDDYNQKHRYFVADEPTRALFHMLAKACRARIIFVEKNNTPEDTMAYEYAYKMMALYLDDITRDTPENWFKKIAKSFDDMTKSLVNKKTCYHDLLLVQLNLPNASEIGDRTGWIHLIQRGGAKVIPAFNMSVQIEALNNGKAPSDINEATRLLARCSYKRSNEDAHFALLCLQYRVPEERFNLCLDYMRDGWPKKTSDHLPDIQVQSDRFIMSKLPVDDKRALIMGDITDCCQSIGGHSEQCVKDLTSLSDNGLYVIQRGNKIIGQAYAWLSDTGNLCLDSIECLPHEIDDDSLRALLQSFAVTVLNQDASIKRVNVGTGGKTPKNLYPEETVVPESMRQGHFYGDANKQYCIVKKPLPLTQEQQLVWDEILSGCTHSFRGCMEYLCELLEKHDDVVSKLSLLVTNYPHLQTELIASRVKRLIYYAKHLSLDDLIPIDAKTLRALPPEERQAVSTARLLWDREKASQWLEIFPFLPLTEQLKLIQNGPEYLTHEAVKFPESLRVILSLQSEKKLIMLKEKNKQGENPLHVAVRYPDSLKIIFSFLKKDEMIALIKEKNKKGRNVLHEAVISSESFKFILSLYPPEERLDAVKEKHSFGPSLLHQATKHPELLDIILTLYPENERLEAISQVDSRGITPLHLAAAESPQALSTILNLLPETDRLKAIKITTKNGNSLLHQAVSSAESLKLILAFYQEEEKLDIIQKKNSYGETILDLSAQFPASFKTILAIYPESQRLNLVREKDGYSQTLLHKAANSLESLETILALYPESERLHALQEKNEFGETVLHKAVESPESLKIILSLYPKNERLAALKEEDKYHQSVLSKVIYSSEVMETVFSLLPIKDQESILSEIEDDTKFPTMSESFKAKLNQFKDNSLPGEDVLMINI